MSQMLATTSSFCRSLLTGDSKRPLASPRRVKDNAPYHSLRGLLVVLALISQLSALNFSCRAAELTDLGQGLSYLRVHAFEETAKGMTAAIRERDFLVLDLRHATPTADSAEQLRTALAAREAKTPVFILVGPATPTALVESLTASAGKCVTLGVKESFPSPRVIVDQPADTDRLAYEALDSGEPLAKLISGKITKERYDESALMKEFAGGNLNASPPTAPDSTDAPDGNKAPAVTTKPGETPAAKPPEPLIDRVLQRAVHLHRAMIAIKQR